MPKHIDSIKVFIADDSPIIRERGIAFIVFSTHSGRRYGCITSALEPTAFSIKLLNFAS